MCQQKHQMECLMWAGKGAPAQSWPHTMEFPPKTTTMLSKATEAHWDFREFRFYPGFAFSEAEIKEFLL